MSPLDAPSPLRNSALDAALAEAREGYAARRPRSAALHERARASLAGGNTRSTLFWSPFPISMARGEGCRLWDADGHEYRDFLGEYTAGLFGHSEARILSAVEAAMGRGIGLGATGEDEARFAELVCARFPSIERVRFTNSGTEANLMALATARAFTGRDRVVAMRGGYHGGVLSFGMAAAARVNAPFPVTLADYNDVEGVAAAVGEDVACVILEPMLGSGGCIPATQEFLARVRDAARACGALLIFDEVMTSRHGWGGLQALTGVTPDLTTLGKYLAGGMSIGAFGGRADAMALYDPHEAGPLTHAGTFNNNVLSMAGGVAALGEVYTRPAAEALYARGEALRARLNAVCGALPMQWMGRGSMLCAHFRRGVTEPYVDTEREAALRELFFLDLVSAGLYLARRGMVSLSLPVGDAECDALVAAVEEFCAVRAPLIRVA